MLGQIWRRGGGSKDESGNLSSSGSRHSSDNDKEKSEKFSRNGNVSTSERHTWKMVGAVIGLFFLILLLTSNSSSSSSQLRTDAQVMMAGVNAPARPRELTIVMNTFKRHDLVLDAVEHYTQCQSVKYMHIIWSESPTVPTKLVSDIKKATSSEALVIFDVQEVDSLNNRFKPLTANRTDAILSVDDDMRVSCQELDLALEVFRASPRSHIGWMPRVHIQYPDGLHYRCWWRVWWEGAYSMVLTKASVLHHDFFHEYFERADERIRAMVDRRRNCEDIAMQFVMANATALPPIYLKGHLGDKGTLNGISTSQNFVKADHMRERDDCLNELVKIYGHNPLVMSHTFVDSAANGWTNAPSTWFEYISSDLWKW